MLMDRITELLQQLAEIKKQELELYNQNNTKFISLFKDMNRYLILKGGGGSGKSIFAGRKVLHRMISEKGHRFLIVRKVAKTLRQSCFQQIVGQISQYYNYKDFKINETDMRIVYKPNGNEILFSGLDDVEKLKSIYNITSIWIEEASEIEEGDLNQLDIRLRGETEYYKQIIVTFNPIDINHWLKKRFFDVVVAGATVHESTYKDNRFLDKEAIIVLEAFKITDPYYYQVYCLNEWGVLGKTIFNALKVNERIALIRDRKPLKVGYFIYDYVNEKIVDKSILWIESDDGYITLYEDVKKGYPYVIGCDPAGEGSDNFGGQVINNTNGKQVAVYHQQQDEDLFTKQIYCLGKYYNYALLGIETNFSTYPVKELQRLLYHNQYMREEEDSISGVLQKRFGFRTTRLTRPLIISELVEIVREQTDRFCDIKTLTEMLTFVRNEKGRPQAKEGAHDDLVMALAIAYYVRTQQRFRPEIEEVVNITFENDPDGGLNKNLGGWFND
jgi:phage terminase large subunit